MNDFYSVIAYIARYWFAALGLTIIVRAVLWLRKESAAVQKAVGRLPDAGFIGEWAVVTSDEKRLPEGKTLPAPRDGWIGCARACDVRLPGGGVPNRAARFMLRRDGLHVYPRGKGVLVDGEPVRREAILRHGATLSVGGVTLQLRLFAGVVLIGEAPIRRGRRGYSADGAPDILPVAGEPPVSTELPKPALTIRRRKTGRQHGTTTPDA